MTISNLRVVKESNGWSARPNLVETATRVYHADSDSVDDTNADLKALAGFPALGDAFESGSNMDAIEITIDRLNGTEQFTYTATVQYSSDRTQKEDAEYATDPINKPARVTINTVSVTERYFTDTAGNSVVNSAGETFSELPERDAAEVVEFSIVKNVASRRTATLMGLRHTLNAASIIVDGVTIAAGKAKLEEISYSDEQVVDNGAGGTVSYYVETLKIVARSSWDDVFDDRGLNELDGGELKPILDTNGDPVVLPYPLDGSGGPQSSPTTAPAQITRKPYASVSWSGLILT